MNNNVPWWKTAIGYQIYPRTFYDANGDGIGDLQGIIQKLPYLEDLGINLIWIGPFFKSPMDDFGYDVEDYYQVDPSYGTLADVEQLIQQAHRRGIRIIIDLVLNHTSDEHKWFIEARKNRYSKYHQYYHWKDANVTREGKILPPNNWRGYFGESAWQYDETARQFYLHIFSRKMPDLNWEYPALRKAMYEVAKYWLDLGIDGFRLDAIAHLAKDKKYTDSALPVNQDGFVLDASKFSNLPRIFDYLDEFKREVLNDYPDVVTIGEVGGNVTPEQSLQYADTTRGPLNMVFNFDTCWENGAYGSEHKSDLEIKTNVLNLKTNFMKWYQRVHPHAWLPIYWLNHDHPRVVSQYGSIKYRNQSAKMLITVLLFLYGTPFIYNGEEIGMSNVDYTKLTQFKDVSAMNFARAAADRLSEDDILRFLRRTSRVNARTPFHWSPATNAGFSTREPFMPLPQYYQEVNLATQVDDPQSIFQYYKQAIALRKSPSFARTMLESKLVLVDPLNPDVFAYQHRGEEHFVVIANFRDYQVDFKLQGIVKKIVLHNYPTIQKQGLILQLRPFECLLISLA